jgi:hypothetical protein
MYDDVAQVGDDHPRPEAIRLESLPPADRPSPEVASAAPAGIASAPSAQAISQPNPAPIEPKADT